MSVPELGKTFDKASSIQGYTPRNEEFLFTIVDTDLTSGASISDVDGGAFDSVRVTLNIQSVGLTPFSFESEQFPISANDMGYVVGVDFGTVSVTVREDRAYTMLQYLHDWKDEIYDTARGVVNPPASYYKTGILTHQSSRNPTGNEIPLAVSRLQNIYPESVDTVDYDYSGDSEPIEYTVDFAVEEILYNSVGEGIEEGIEQGASAIGNAVG